MEPTQAPTNAPSVAPTAAPTDIPTMPTSAPTEPDIGVKAQISTTSTNQINQLSEESGSVSPLTIAIIVIVVLFVVLACHAVFLLGRYRKRKEENGDVQQLEEIVDDEGNVRTDLPIHSPEDQPLRDEDDDADLSPEPIYDEPLEPMSKPEDKQLVCE